MRLAVVSVLLVALLAASIGVQWRKNQQFSAAMVEQGDNVAHSLFQAENEYLRLVAAWSDPSTDPAEARLRYEIFVSRLNLLRTTNSLRELVEQPEVAAVLSASEGFVEAADRLHPADGGGVAEADLRTLRSALLSLREPMRDLTRAGTRITSAAVTRRNEAVRTQNRIGIAMTVLLAALTLATGALVWHQLRRERRRRDELERLAHELREARVAAEAASQAKSAFLANMSHEIRTPFQGLLGMLAQLRDSPLDGRQAECLRTATASADHLLALLNDILDLSRMESGGLQIHPQPTAPRALLQAVDSLMRPLAVRKGLALRIEVDPAVPDTLALDPIRVRQVLFNLVANAIKFTESGGVTVRVSRVGDDGDGAALLRCEVTDTGIGMDAAALAKLFSRFAQADESRTRRFGGTGLGLEISRGLARLMGGDIVATSVSGEGSTFVFSLPLQVAPPAVDEAAPRPPALPAVGRLRLLVAEDHEVNRLVLQALIERMGHQVVFAADGDEVVRCAADGRFDLVLMDLHMPGRDGFDATRAIRSLPDGLAAAVPVVALTADAFPETRQRCLETGMDDFLTKPVAADDLAACLARRFGREAAGAPPTALQPA